MYWLTQLLKRGPRARASLLESVRFDTKGWTLAKRSRDSLVWCNTDGDTLRACVHSKLTGTLSGLSDPDSLRAFYREEAIKHGGGIVCAEIVRAGGIRSVKVINKCERRPAYAYDGTLTIPLKNAHYTITMQSVERGVTGVRDAVVSAHLADRGELAIEEVEDSAGARRVKGWFQDPYDPSYQGCALYSMSDDERLDAMFPHHPLSKVRRCLTRVQNTLAINQAVARDCVEVPSEAEAAERPRYLLSCETVATLLLTAGMFDQAASLLADSIADLEQTAGVNDLRLARQLSFLGLAHEGQGRHIEAERVLSRSWGIFRADLGDDHPETAQAVMNLARMHVSMGRHDEAEPLLLQALRVFEEKNVAGSNVGVVLNELGRVLNARGLYAQAIPRFERALKIIETVHGPEFCDCATVLRNMALSLRHTGEDQRAEEALNRARRIEAGECK